MQLFWGSEYKNMYDIFKTRPIVLGCVIDLSQLRDSHCSISSYLKAKKLALLFSLCGLEFIVRIFYANLRISVDSDGMETLVMGNCIIVNELLFEDVFGTKFSGVIPYINGVWLDDFEVSLESAKIAMAEPDSDLYDFGPLSL
ncbi:hypothetical protein H5410_035528 [Solanum commersonii]|uniref:Uncharacterized protein n=1 Tax=Solanum commersonii TaxID=4109 RepID=A0A9J5Y405_SOLCO|nr:hypothetical protein H5410_035528 [Solanum commersonii]